MKRKISINSEVSYLNLTRKENTIEVLINDLCHEHQVCFEMDCTKLLAELDEVAERISYLVYGGAIKELNELADYVPYIRTILELIAKYDLIAETDSNGT